MRRLILALILFSIPFSISWAGQRAALWPTFTQEVERAGVVAWAPRLAAQIQVESAWDASARSQYAAGLAQFTPATWADIAPHTQPSCGDAPPTDPACSIRAQIVYMSRLTHRHRYDLEIWPLSWAAYNGGPGWIRREKARCRLQDGCNPTRWYGHVERHCLPGFLGLP